MNKFNTIPEALADLRKGNLIIVVDDEDRENEGDLIGSAEKCSPDMINFMATHGKGLICAAITKQRSEQLDLKMMVCGEDNSSLYDTPFTVSVDYRHGTTTGISAEDRSKTVLGLVNSMTSADDFSRPGHIFPLVAKDGGIFERGGHTEATVDLMELAGLNKAGVLCEILNTDGTMARTPDLMCMAARFNLKIITIKDLLNYKLRYESRVDRVVTVDMPTRYGEFDLIAFRDRFTGQEHLVLKKGTFTDENEIIVRIHSECLTGDVFGSSRCDCGDQLQKAIQLIEKQKTGLVLYMREEGRGIGLFNKLKAYSLQEAGLDTVQANRALGFDADKRDYSVAASILYALNVNTVALLSNNPNKCKWLDTHGITVTRRIPLISGSNNSVFKKKYLHTKETKMGHVIELKNYN